MVDKTAYTTAAEMAAGTAVRKVGMTANKTAAKLVGMTDGTTAV